MISIAICDDSLQDATRLRGLCESFSSACEIEYSVFTDAEEFLSEYFWTLRCQTKADLT